MFDLIFIYECQIQLFRSSLDKILTDILLIAQNNYKKVSHLFSFSFASRTFRNIHFILVKFNSFEFTSSRKMSETEYVLAACHSTTILELFMYINSFLRIIFTLMSCCSRRFNMIFYILSESRTPHLATCGISIYPLLAIMEFPLRARYRILFRANKLEHALIL